MKASAKKLQNKKMNHLRITKQGLLNLSMLAYKVSFLIFPVALVIILNGCEKVPAGAKFDPEVYRTWSEGDNYYQTWGSDGHLYVSMDDGTDPWILNLKEGVNTGFKNNHVYRIKGAPLHFNNKKGGDVKALEYGKGKYPSYNIRANWYGFGILAVGDTIYHCITRCDNDNWGPFSGAKLIFSPNNGENWYLPSGALATEHHLDFDDEYMFFKKESTDWRFSYFTYLQNGQAYSGNSDGYVYLYSSGGKDGTEGKPWNVYLARVPKNKVTNRDAYEFTKFVFEDESAEWTKDINAASPIHVFPRYFRNEHENGFRSHMPHVVYNKDLGKYIMASFACVTSRTTVNQLYLLWADNPWGPWTVFHHDKYWVNDETDDARLFSTVLSPKHIYDNGTTMYLIYSDSRYVEKYDRNWSYPYYRWNQQKFTIQLND